MRPQAAMENLGYPPLQAKVYLGLLKMGSGTVTDISHALHIPRSTIKDLVEEMHLCGLINYYPKRSHKVWTPENPQKLLINWQEREGDFKSILPRLSELYNKRAEASFSVKVFSGSKEIRLLLEDIIDYKRNIFAYAAWDDLAKVFTPQVAWNFFERLSEHFLNILLLVPQTDSALVLKTNQSVYRKVKFLPQALASELSACFVYGDRLVLIRLLENSPQGVILQDEALARQQRMFLQNLWDRL